jgi:hypothetical protein
MNINKYKKNKEKSKFIQAVFQGLTDIKQGDVERLEVVKKQLGIT